MYHIADLLDRKVSLFVKTGCVVPFVGIKDFGGWAKIPIMLANEY